MLKGKPGKKHTEETKLKQSMSAKLRPKDTEETKQKKGSKNIGKKFTEEHKKKIGEANRGKTQIAWNRGKPAYQKKWKILDIIDGTEVIVDCLKEYCKEKELNWGTVRNAVRDSRVVKNRYIFHHYDIISTFSL
jgi:hypothetical protein